MKEITEDYCDFETAKLLKEKGFNEKCFRTYFNDGIISRIFDDKDEIYNENLLPSVFAAPTLQMAMKWLREKHNIIIDICPNLDGDYNVMGTYCRIIYKNGVRVSLFVDFDDFKTYEKACEAAIKYCLENLI